MSVIKKVELKRVKKTKTKRQKTKPSDTLILHLDAVSLLHVVVQKMRDSHFECQIHESTDAD